MSAITLPLPADVDLSEMPHFPVRHQRLLKSKSWRRARMRPELGFYMFNLWIAAFLAVPAGSIEDDDDELCDAAQCHPRDWPAVKEDCLKGWVLIEGRWWHQTVAELSWDLWEKRLDKRHKNASDSWRAACKQAESNGREPPEPPGSFGEWCAARFPATHIYMCARQSQRETAISPREDGVIAAMEGENRGDCSPKRSKGKLSTPLTPLGAGGETGLERGAAAKPAPSPAKPVARDEGRKWFAQTLGELQRGFGPVGNLIIGELQAHASAGMGAKVLFVNTFKGSEFRRGGTGVSVALPSRARALDVRERFGPMLAAIAEMAGTTIEITWKGAH